MQEANQQSNMEIIKSLVCRIGCLLKSPGKIKRHQKKKLSSDFTELIKRSSKVFWSARSNEDDPTEIQKHFRKLHSVNSGGGIWNG